MSSFIVPKNYKSKLNLHDTQVGIKVVKDFFQTSIAYELDLLRVSAPSFVDKNSGLNDNLNGVERPVSFDILDEKGVEAEVVHSLAKWKRYALNRYGFKFEVLNKFDDIRILDCFNEFYKFLPLGHILNKEILVLHGGLFSKEGVTIDELKKLERGIDIPTSGLMTELLWSDPKEGNGWEPSERGAGVYFGEDVTEKFLNNNNLTLLIRSHEVKMEGYEIQHGGKTITLFSAPNYYDMTGNKGAIIRIIGEEMELHFIQYDAVPHPDFVSKNN